MFFGSDIFNKENLSLVISLFALLSSWGIWFNSRKAFLSTNYPKITAELYLPNLDDLPTFNVFNESDKIVANNLRIEISIRNLWEFHIFRGKWLIYTLDEIDRLKPLERFVPSGMSSDDLCNWLKDRGYKTKLPLSNKKQKILSHISQKKSYKVRLIVYYTSNIYGANKTCKISKKYRLIPCSKSNARHPEDRFYWNLI